MARGKVLQTVIDISGEISPTLGKTIDGVAQKLEGVNKTAIIASASLAAIGTGAVVGIAKAGKALASLGDEYNVAVNNLSAATGIVGDELDSMADSISDIYAMNLGESFDDISDAMASAKQNTSLTGDALQDLTADALRLRDTFEYDVSETTRAADALMTNFGISGEEAMNLIASGAQNGLDYSGELIDTINEYSVQFAKIGLDAEDMFAILQSGADGTAWTLDKVGDAVKEFAIRAVDGSDTTIEGFEAIGLNADEMMKTFAAGGEAANEAFYDVLNGLVAIEDPVARDAAGVNLLGTMWEDMGVEAIKALADTEGAAYDAGDALEQIGEVKYDNLTDAFEAIKRKGETALLPVATTIANAFTDIVPIISDLFDTLGPIIEETTDQMMPFLVEFLDGVKDTLITVVPMIAEMASELLPLLGELMTSLLPPILDLISSILPPLMTIIQALLPAFTQILSAILPLLGEIVAAILPTIMNILSALLPVIRPLLDLVVQLLNDFVLPLIEPMMQLVNALLPVIEPILSAIISLLSPLLSLLEPLADVLGTIVGWISKVVGWVADGLTWVVSLIFGDSSAEIADTATVNGYAAGGFTQGLSIAGEDPRYPMEAVISFNPAYREENLSYWARAGRMLGASPDDAGFSLSGGSGGYVIDMGGVTFAPKITFSGKADKDSIMKAIEDEYPEFLDMLEQWLIERGVTVYG